MLLEQKRALQGNERAHSTSSHVVDGPITETGILAEILAKASEAPKLTAIFRALGASAAILLHVHRSVKKQPEK